jgi:hypothetical protein
MPRSLSTKLKVDEFYCLPCRKRCKGEEIHYKKIRNKKRDGVPTLRAYCKKCDCIVSKIIKEKDIDKMIDRFGK